MPQEIETVTYTQVVQIVDADGKPIREGSVLRHTCDLVRGVVIKIRRAGDIDGPMCSAVGDLCIHTGPGSTRVSNGYSRWRHIPHNEQTYQERYLSWAHRPYLHDEYSRASADEGLAIDGIMSLLPDDIVDWEFGPHPDRIGDALKFLVEHLDTLNKSKA